jgi:5-methyltetrahydrofolate--homocysteine methyltransferase
MNRSDFKAMCSNKVLVLDGGMGTMIQTFGLNENDFRGLTNEGVSLNGFAFATDQKGNNDLLCLTRPDVITEIHRRYVEAGADILSTCTFNANAISMRDYGTESLCRKMNLQGAKLARKVADSCSYRRVLVAGSMGPTNKAASMSPDMSDPGMRDVSYDDLYVAYSEQIEALIDGGVDLLLFETVFDTLNLKAGLDAADHAIAKSGKDIAVMVSLTLSSTGGRTFSGQTIPAFLTSIAHGSHTVSVGLNCSFGAEDMLPYLEELSVETNLLVTAHPNAGLPDGFGMYRETPAMMAATIAKFLDKKLVNVIGGCCGTTPDHIAAIRKEVDARVGVRKAPNGGITDGVLRLSGLEMLEIKPENNFVNIGERCNVAGSRKFLRLIKEKNYAEALQIARKQVEDGALIIDINMDDGMLDAPREMKKFLNLLASEPDIAKVPLMIDSSNKDVIREALKCVQGKCVVNSIS